MNTMIEQYNNFIFSGDPYVRQFFLLRTIKPMVALISTYVLFVTYIGPKIMRNRKPIELRKMIVIYNFAVIAFYIYFLMGGAYFWYQFGFKTFCDFNLDSRNPVVRNYYFHGYVLYFVRYVELIDTVFLVLSKKFRRITPLHVFHHAIVPVFGWFGFRSEKSGYLSAFMAMNSIIHVIMYSYYSIAALGPKYQKYLWWKKYLTAMQIGQFFLTAVYIIFMYSIGCCSSKFVFVSSMFLMVIFFFWFIQFYRTAFRAPITKKVHQNGVSEQNGVNGQNSMNGQTVVNGEAKKLN